MAGLNTYAYVNASPLANRDLLGLVCGSGPNDWIIPDNPFGFGFKPCCYGHDDCYRDCANGPIKEECDGRFYRCLRDKCSGFSGAIKWACEVSAAGYFTGVDRKGHRAYNNARGGR
jgi:hypothetical protein